MVLLGSNGILSSNEKQDPEITEMSWVIKCLNRSTIFKLLATVSWRFLRPFGDLQSENYVHYNTNTMFFLLSTSKSALRVKRQRHVEPLVLQHEWHVTPAVQVVTDCMSHRHALAGPKKKKPVWLKNVFDEGAEIFHFIKYWTPSACLFSALAPRDEAGKRTEQLCRLRGRQRGLEPRPRAPGPAANAPAPAPALGTSVLAADRQSAVAQSSVFGRHNSENEWSELTTQGEITNTGCQLENSSFQVQVRILENLYLLLWGWQISMHCDWSWYLRCHFFYIVYSNVPTFGSST